MVLQENEKQEQVERAEQAVIAKKK